MQSGYLIDTDGEISEITVPNRFSLGFLQGIVGGPIQRVNTADGKDMIVHEEGMVLDLKVNPKAYEVLSDRYKPPHGCTFNIHGKAFVYTKGRL